jgi:hypothetical protein
MSEINCNTIFIPLASDLRTFCNYYGFNKLIVSSTNCNNTHYNIIDSFCIAKKGSKNSNLPSWKIILQDSSIKIQDSFIKIQDRFMKIQDRFVNDLNCFLERRFCKTMQLNCKPARLFYKSTELYCKTAKKCCKMA